MSGAVEMEIAGAMKTNAPVAPKTLPRGNSHIPAKNCARPPEKQAMPTTTLGVWMFLAFTLYIERMNVVDANENKPLRGRKCWMACREGGTYRAPGLATLEVVRGATLVGLS